jgi:preprotein translocase subunit SecA
MNQQREVVYRYRDEILEGRDMSEAAREALGDVVTNLVQEYTAGEYIEDWDIPELFEQARQIFPVSFGPDDLDVNAIDREELGSMLTEEAEQRYTEREGELGEELMRMLERYLLLQIIDQRWREHLYDMDYLREGIHLRGFAQIDPLVAYKNEAYTLFSDLMNTIWSDFTRMIFNVEVEIESENGEVTERYAAPAGSSQTAVGQLSYMGGVGEQQPSALAAAAAGIAPEAVGYGGEEEELDLLPEVEQRRVDETEQIGRNDPCWCGSGKKFKKCHGA